MILANFYLQIPQTRVPKLVAKEKRQDLTSRSIRSFHFESVRESEQIMKNTTIYTTKFKMAAICFTVIGPHSPCPSMEGSDWLTQSGKLTSQF